MKVNKTQSAIACVKYHYVCSSYKNCDYLRKEINSYSEVSVFQSAYVS